MLKHYANCDAVRSRRQDYVRPPLLSFCTLHSVMRAIIFLPASQTVVALAFQKLSASAALRWGGQRRRALSICCPLVDIGPIRWQDCYFLLDWLQALQTRLRP